MSENPTVREELTALLRLSWPITTAQLGLMAMGLVDIAILGRVSARELAGSAIARAVMFAAITPAMGIALALEPLASQAVGAKELGRAWGALRATSRAMLLAGLPLVLLGVLSLFLLESLGIDHEVASRARVFALTVAPGQVLTLVFLTHKTFLQAQSRTRPALIASAVANVLNLVVCNLLVRGDEFLESFGLPRIGLPPLGALGAGLAYSFASGVMTTIVVRASTKLKPEETGALGVSGESVRADGITVQDVIRLGMPVGFQLLAEVGVFALCTVLVGRFGPAAVAAHQVALGLASFSFMGALGFSGGAAVRVGYAIGEGRSPRRAGLVGIACGAVFMSMSGVVFALFPAALVGVFTRDAEVAALGVQLVIIAAFFQLFDGLQAVGAGALRGAADVRFPFVASVAAHWVVGFPSAVVLGFVCHLGVRGIWWGLASGLITVSALLVLRFLYLTRGVVHRV